MTQIDYASRRARLAQRMRADGAGAVLVLFSAPIQLRNGDVEQDYRQDSDFYYLTGFSEPESVAVFSADARDGQGELTLFVRRRNPAREVWDGPRVGVEGVEAFCGAQSAFGIDELGKELPTLLENKNTLYFAWGNDSIADAAVRAALGDIKRRARAGVWPPRTLVEPSVHLHEMRLRKDADEVACMRRAAAITAVGHERCMASAKSGMGEFELDAMLLSAFRAGGSERVAYTSIVGSGPNACILHYRAGARRMADGELVLIDAGCELEGYASDVTRVFPVSGKFSVEQRAIYELVLKAEEESIAAVKPGVTLDSIHALSVRILTEGLVALGLLQGQVEDLIRNESYKRFYMHRTSHWLGMDVHDAGTYFVQGKVRLLEPGMVLTVEPGLYIAVDDTTVDAKWRGIGVRIEDDILVTPSGHENLTALIPKAVADVERVCART